MVSIDVTKSCLNTISQMSEHIKDAILYLDSGCSESFLYVGAFPMLLDLGVRAVCSLENLSSLDAVVNWNWNWNSNTNPARKIVVITCRLLSDVHRYILRCLSTHQFARHCTVFTSISEVAHSIYPDSPLGPDAFHEYESLLIQDYEELVKKHQTKLGYSEDSNFQESLTSKDAWSQITLSGRNFGGDDDHTDDVGQKLVVSVCHFPMVICPLSPRVFVLPSESLVAESSLSAQHENSLSPGLPPLYTGVPLDGDDVPPGALLTAHLLYDLASKMDLKLEIFSLGDLSKTVGKIMTDMSSLYEVRRHKRPAGLLLIDRTLDLLTPCCHGDSLVDLVFSYLPRRERKTFHSHMTGSQTNLKCGPSLWRTPLGVQIPLGNILGEEDSKIDYSRLVESIDAFKDGWHTYKSAPQIAEPVNIQNEVHDQASNHFDIQLLDGSFVSTETFRGMPFMEAILDRRTKHGVVLVKKWLQESLRQENITGNFKIQPRVSIKSEMQSMIKALAKNQSSLIKNEGIIQLAAAVLVALDELPSARWDAFISAEKTLSASAEGTSQNLAAQIGDLLNKSSLVGSNEQKDGRMDLSKGLLSFQDALLLMIIGYILAGENFPTSGSGGPFSWQEEHFLKDTIINAILENSRVTKLKFLHSLTEELEEKLNRNESDETIKASGNQSELDDFDDEWSKWGDEEEENDDKNRKEKAYGDAQLKLELRDKVDNLFKFLHKLSTLNRRNVALKEDTFSVDGNFVGHLDLKKGLIYKLLTRVLARDNVSGLEYHSSTVGRLFKSGFGRFGLGQAKPSLADQNVILVFVIGGINGAEVREAHEALSDCGRPDVELIIGGTTFLTPDDMLDLLIGNFSYL